MTKRTITVDLESWTPSPLSNTTGGIHPGQTLMYSAGRQTGKSYYQKMMLNAMYNGTNLDTDFIFKNTNEPKYKFSRAKWYEAEYDWVHYGEVNDWCKQHFGPHDIHPDAWSRWNHKYEGKILFRDEKDCVFFMLRWS